MKPAILKELEKLAKETRKYKNAEEFTNNEMSKKYPGINFLDRGGINRLLHSQIEYKNNIKNEMDTLRAKIVDEKLLPQKVNRIEEIKNKIDIYTEKVRMVEDYPEGYSIGRVLETPIHGGKSKYGIYKNGQSLVGTIKNKEIQKGNIRGFFGISEDSLIKENVEFAKLWEEWTTPNKYDTNKMHDEYTELILIYTQTTKGGGME